MKKNLFFLFLTIITAIAFSACSSDDKEDVRKTKVTLTIGNPSDLDGLSLGTWSVIFTERNTGAKTVLETTTNTLNAELAEGDYEITGENNITYKFQSNSIEGKLYFTNKSVVLIGNTKDVTIESFLKSDYNLSNGGFLIEEIYYTGSVTPEGKTYSGDQYIKLYNNTDKTLYADGLFLAVTQRSSGNSYTYTPDVILDAVPVGAIIVIPGNGTKYPVAAGASFVLTASAVNHKLGNSNSFDLSTANMEWVNVNLTNQPANNPNVDDAKALYDSFVLHNKGLTSIVLGRLDVSQDEFIEKYTYSYSWETVINGVEYKRGPFTIYQIPNKWVMDAVYTSVEGKAIIPVFAPSLDLSWTYCGGFDGDTNRFGKSVQRKVESTTADGRKILKDTNNSKVDFTPNTTPSLSK